ncbi:MAG TPA: LysR family transcriptional regulator [Burkholderiaceae bacterium]|nr:LysR family transcriptional regulator [Burkholderiaceae bacterium]
MDLEANDLLLFARVVGEGSFSRAALRLGMPKSTLSRRMTALEAQLGERLLLRTTRKLAVTDFGHSMLLHAQQVTSEVEAALALAQHRQVAPSGRLRVSMPADFANIVLAPMLAQFVAAYPAISLELDLSPRRVDLIGENFDLAIRMGDLTSDASLAARQLAVFSTGLYAAPSYLAKHGMPLEPEALMEHDVLRILARTGEPIPWQLSRADAQWEGTPPGRVTANSPELLMQMARAGAGITAIGDHFAAPYLRSGELVQLMADWSLPTATAWAVFPGRRLMPSRTRVFLDAMLAEFSGPNCREKEAQIKRAKVKPVAH